VSAKPSVNDELTLLIHLEKTIRNGILGKSEYEILGEDPKRRLFAGVLFPSEDVLPTTPREPQGDPQPQYLSIVKNCNIGLEFLVKPKKGSIKLNVSGSFKLYPRVFPTFYEQLTYLEYLTAQSNSTTELDSESYDSDFEGTTTDQDATGEDPEVRHKGLSLAEKYRQVEVRFQNLEITLDPARREPLPISLKEALEHAIQRCMSWNDLFSVSPDCIDKHNTVKITSIPQNAKAYAEFIEGIRSSVFRLPNWSATLIAEQREYKTKSGDVYTQIVVSLVNTTPALRDSTELPTGHPLEFFDCELRVSVANAEHIPYEFDGIPYDYRTNKKFDVKGINCVGYRADHTPSVTFYTDTVPMYFQDLYRTRDDLSVRFSDLLNPDSVVKTLKDITLRMRQYLDEWKMFIENKGDASHRLRTEQEVESCRRDMEEFEKEISSFELGIYALQRDSRLMQAFTIMNQVFLKSGAGKYRAWRLFQIVFIVRILPSLFAREVSDQDPRRTEIIDSINYADVLWFPTGGGKTEAYLGLITTALFYDRLRGKKTGCTAWLRFPLRMLSKQQLDRIARVLMFAEEYRQADPQLTQGAPFSIGFFAGSGNTDNFVDEHARRKYFQSETAKTKKMLLHRCPYCGSKLKLDFDDEAWRFLHVCGNRSCFVVNSSVLRGVLPVYITDSEVYRFVPSVLCGTVDKLAILSRYREFAHIFGQVNGKCPKHGYFSDGCIVGLYDKYRSCNESARKTTVYRDYVQRLRAEFYDPVPLLLIQDELHLLKEELGALDSHYEGAVLEFARNFGKKEYHLPKIIAATATIEAYDRHINHLYTRKARRYPSMGYKKGESFYATSTPVVKRRLYIGILPHTRALDEVINRCLYLYHREIVRLYRDPSAWTEFSWENITNREEFLELLSLYDMSVVYVNEKNRATDILRRLSEVTTPRFKTELNDENFEHHTEVLTGADEMDRIVDTIDRIEMEKEVHTYPNKLHTLIATSLISHGVDLERINAFFLAGMPSKQAEYIQATSRSARSHAGMVVSVFRPNDLRERSQYQYFVQNHIFMDQLVDPVPINRLTIKAIERTTPGLLSGLLLCVHSQRHTSTIYNCDEYRKYCADLTTKGIDIRAELLKQLKRIIGTTWDYFPLSARKRAEDVIEDQFVELDNILHTAPATEKIKSERVLNPLTSFRDIEEGIPLEPTHETGWILASLDRMRTND
jgi:hypothetical protein